MKKSVKKLILTVLSVALIVTLSVTATLAWLKDTTAPVVNTFTEGKVDIDLYEHKYDLEENQLTADEIRNDGNTYKMVPGDVLPKDPTVVVKAGSEACWLFVKVEKTDNVDTFLTYSIDTGVWTPLADTNNDGVADNGVYYKKIAAYTEADAEHNVLTNNQVSVKAGVTMADMETLTTNDNPKLTFTAYAIQSANIKDANGDNTAAAAWDALNS